MNKIMTALFLMAISTGAMADLVLTINVHQNMTLKKMEKNKFEKIDETTTGNEKLEKVKNGSVVIITEKEINIADDNSKFSLEITGKNIVKIEDEKEQVSAEVEATITKSLFGKLKAINIEGKQMDSVYAEAYKRSGLDILKKLKLGNIASSEITTSDLKCNAEGDLLKCNQDQELTFTLNSLY